MFLDYWILKKIFQLPVKHKGVMVGNKGGKGYFCLMGIELRFIRSFQILLGNNLNIVSIT